MCPILFLSVYLGYVFFKKMIIFIFYLLITQFPLSLSPLQTTVIYNFHLALTQIHDLFFFVVAYTCNIIIYIPKYIHPAQSM